MCKVEAVEETLDVNLLAFARFLVISTVIDFFELFMLSRFSPMNDGGTTEGFIFDSDVVAVVRYLC
jgi:hypothetical protein